MSGMGSKAVGVVLAGLAITALVLVGRQEPRDGRESSPGEVGGPLPSASEQPGATAAPAPEIATTGALETPPAAPLATPPFVRATNGRLGIRVENQPLTWVLDEISQQSEVAFVTDVGVEEETISATIAERPLDDGLRDLLLGKDTFFHYDATGALQVVWIYPAGKGQGLQPVPTETWADSAELEQRLNHADSEVRTKAIETLIARRGQDALGAVLHALRDEDWSVRAQALYAASGARMELPAERLMALLREDPSPDVRFLALQALVDDPSLEVAAEYAANDPSAIVREEAEEILQQLDEAKQ